MAVAELTKKTHSNSASLVNQEYFQNFTYDPSKQQQQQQQLQQHQIQQQQPVSSNTTSKTVTFGSTPNSNSKTFTTQAPAHTPLTVQPRPATTPPQNSHIITTTNKNTGDANPSNPSSQTNGPYTNEHTHSNVHYTGTPYSFAK
jgi:hypothetical protein